MLESLDVASFTPRLGETFMLEAGDGTELSLILSEARTWGSSAGGKREPFRLLFHGPVKPWVPQRTYKLRNESLGTEEIFLVPIGPDARGMRYEAIFS